MILLISDAARARRASRPAPRLGLPALGLAGLALAGCGGRDAPPRWLSLARGFQPRPLAETVAAWESAPGAAAGTRADASPLRLELSRDVGAADWRPAEPAGCWSAEIPPGALRASGAAPRLVGRGREYLPAQAGRELAPGELRAEGGRLTLRLRPENRHVPPTLLLLAGPAPSEHPLPSAAWRSTQAVGTFALDLPEAVAAHAADARLFAELARVDEARELAPFEYRVGPESVILCWPEGAPPAMRLAASVEHGRDVDGAWQLRVGRFCANGIGVWSGAREELALDVPLESRLSFRFVHGGRPGSGAVRARVRLDGALLHEAATEPGAAPLDVAVELPEDGARGARLAFEVEGAPGLGAFFAPTIGPAQPGAPGARPWGARPDVVLFLADTFRADSLALYGGDPALAPEIGRFAERALRFANARSNAAWTLPSIGSMLTGVQPGQHGATDEDLSLPAFHTTIAEALSRAGYRTGAITDGSFFSPVFGLDQGFEWFAQRDAALWDLDATLAEARAFLEQDDGRPVFLVVHTYRVHQPYRVGPHEDRRPYDELIERARVESGTDSPEAAAGFGLLAQHADELRELYRAGVRDLDRGFGELIAYLEGRSFFEHGWLALTSDHGEALGENREFFHGRTLWEVKLRVPLLLRGPDVAPRTVEHAAWPLDLPPTFAAIAGLEPDPRWVGTSLLSLDRERPSFAFQLVAKSRQVALLDGTRKVLVPADPARLEQGACEHAFDLATDPREENDLAKSADWPAELTRRLAPAVLGALQPLGREESAGVPPEMLRELEGLGYGRGGETQSGPQR